VSVIAQRAETVDAKMPFKTARQRRPVKPRMLRVQFARQSGHNVE